MLFSASTNYKFFLQDYNFQQDKLSASMRRISTGQRFIVPGEAPADLGISERFKAQIVNTEEASRVIQNATNLFQTTDAFMQNSSDILNRMSELAIAAFDSSKNDGDRLNLDLEFQQLKDELGRISEVGKYNGLQINGKTGVAVWDAYEEKVTYYQPDGSGESKVEYVMSRSATSQNGIKYNFINNTSALAGDYTFSNDGKSLFYFSQQDSTGGGTTLNQRNTIMKLDLESDTINYVELGVSNTADFSSTNYRNRLKMDQEGRIWASHVLDGADTMTISLINENEITFDNGGSGSTNAWAGGITDVAQAYQKASDFAVDDNSIYYIRSAAGQVKQFVRRDMFDVNKTQVLIDDLSARGLISTNALGTSQIYAVSNDGRYIAYEGAAANNATGTIFVLDTFEDKQASLIVGTAANSIVDIGFDYNNSLYWTNTGNTTQSNTISKVRLSSASDGTPQFHDQEVLVNSNVGHLGVLNSAIAGNVGGGMSITGGSPATNYRFQTGPDAGMDVELSSGDVRLFTLGVSKDNVRTMEDAQKAVENIQDAISIVANQRAIIGSQVSRLSYTLGTNASYSTNISAAESRLRDVDIPSESAKMTSGQIASQAAMQILEFSNSQRPNILRLLQNL